MKIGLIARCEYARGIAIQSRNFYDHMPVERVLLVRKQAVDLDCEERPEWYPGATHVTYDHLKHTIPEDACKEWLEGLDVVFTVETTYDWRFADWARSLGVKTVIQGNPEFFRHDQSDLYRAHPDAWWWPTPWRVDRLPTGRYVPVPMPDFEPIARTDGEVNFLHVVGKRAYADRNGTDIVINALRAIQEPCDFTIHGFGHEIRERDVRNTLSINSPVRLHFEESGVEDRWDMYRDQSVLVLPRRYGGLCLPALEAAACGLAVSMPACSPNHVLAVDMYPARDDGYLNLACGRVPTADTGFYELGKHLTDLARSPGTVRSLQEIQLKQAPRWSEYRQVYLDELAMVR